MHKTFFLFLVLFGAIITVSGCGSSVSDLTIDGTGPLVTGALTTSSGMIDQVNSITGNVIGTTQVFPQFEKGRFFIVAHDTSRQSEFDVFDKNNLEKSLYTITLPQTTTGKYITWAPQKLLFFDKSDSLYMIAYFQSKNSGVLGDPEYIVFKVSFTGSVVPLASLGKGIPLGDEIIDRDAGMIAWHDTSIIKVFDIATKEYHKLSYTAPKENLIVSRILSYRDNIITFLVDRTEVSGITPQAIVVTADMTLQKTISTIPYTTYHIPSKIIEYQDCDMGGACSLFSVNGGKVRHYTGGIYFTDLINNGQLLFGWYDGNVGEGSRRLQSGLPMYAFIPLAELE